MKIHRASYANPTPLHPSDYAQVKPLLLKHAEELAMQKGAVEIDLFVDAKSEKLLNFYKKRHFVASQNAYVPMWKELE